MLTTLATPVAIGLLAVTFGWTPNEQVASKAGADSYVFEMRLSDADLEALRAGRVDSLSSELPRDLRDIQRVRITFGAGTPKRVLTQRDRQSPRRIAAEGAPKPHVVAKPVVTPEWGDPAKLVASPTAQRWTVRQGQGAFGPGGLAEGFREGVSRTNEFVENQARNLTDRTRDALQRGSETIRDGASGLINSAGRTLDNNLPPRGGPFGQRPQANQFGQPPLPADNRVQPPNPTATAVDDRFQSTTPAPTTLLPREPLPSRFQNDSGFSSRQGDPDPRGVQGPEFARPVTRNERLVESFTDRDRAANRQLTPIDREPPRQPISEYDSFASPQDFARPAARDYPDYSDQRDRFTQTQAGFPDRNPGAPPQGYAPMEEPRPPYREPFATQRPPTQLAGAAPLNTPPARDDAAGDWAGGATRTTGADTPPPAAKTAETDPREPGWGERLMMFALTAVTCFTLFAYFDLRNRYRMALRGLPHSGYSPTV